MLKKSLVTKRCTGFLCFVENQLWPSPYGLPFFEAITDISLDAESHEEQNCTSHFIIGASYGRFSKGMQVKKEEGFLLLL